MLAKHLKTREGVKSKEQNVSGQNLLKIELTAQVFIDFSSYSLTTTNQLLIIL